jgi:hypothetical protein
MSLTLILLLSACGVRQTEEKENLAAAIDDNLAVIMSHQEGSGFVEYTVAHKAEYDEILALGDAALPHLFSLLENGVDGEKAVVIARACRELLGAEDIRTSSSANGRGWYEVFKVHVLRMRARNTMEYIEENNPRSAVLLEVLAIPRNTPVKTLPPLVLPVANAYDPTKPLAEDEFVLHNGVRFGMTYDEVLAATGEDVVFLANNFNFDVAERVNIGQDGVQYGFQQKAEDSEFYLLGLSIQNGGDYDGMTAYGDTVAPIFRDISIGDTLESVFDKFPVRDRELKQWAEQALYGEPPANYAILEYVAGVEGSYYSMTLVADHCSAHIVFSRLEQKVLGVILSERNL